MYKRLIVLLFTLFSLTLFADGFENYPVERLDLLPFSNDTFQINDSAILNKLQTKKGELFSQIEFDQDLKMLSKDFERIEPDVRLINKKLYITLRLQPKAVIRSICFQGNKSFKDSKLLEELDFTPGTTYDQAALLKGINKLRAYYIAKGYFEIDLSHTIQRDPTSNEVDINICIKEGRAGRVWKICFHNFTECEEEAIKELMMTKEYSFPISLFDGSGQYRPEIQERDEYFITQYLQNQGYADAKVQFEVEDIQNKHRIILHITADKGEIYYTGKVSFEGNQVFSDELIESLLTIKEGCPYSQGNVQQSIERIIEIYGKNGFIDAYVDFIPIRDETWNIFNVKLIIHEGKQYSVGLVKVLGNCTTKTKVILHESLMSPGEVLNLEKLSATEARLKNMDYFSSVNVYPSLANELKELDDCYRDIYIEVEEKQTGELGGFVAFSTSENLLGGVNITEKNFNIKGVPSLLGLGHESLRGGGEYASLSTTLGKKAVSVHLSWTKPHFNDTLWSVGFDAEHANTKYISEGYSIKKIGSSVHATYDLNAFMRVQYHYRFINSKVKKLDKNTEFTGKNKAIEELDGLVCALGATFIYDSTDHFLRPTHGYRSRVSYECAGIGGRYNFLSFSSINSFYTKLDPLLPEFFPLRDKLYGVISLKADFRFIIPFGHTDSSEIPLDERFFLGGQNLIRGYRPFQIGPKFLDKLGNATNDPSGGISMYLLTAEYTHPLFSMADAFVFYDAGFLTDAALSIDSPYATVGFGVKLWVMPGNPPVSMGWGYPVDKKNADKSDLKRFFINIGGKF